MSHPTTFSQPPEPVTTAPASLVPPPAPAEALAAIEETVRRLRAEVAAAPERERQARLLTEIADLEERAGDEPAATRDYLAAYNTDSTFREPLEGLLRLLEKRRSLKNLGKLIEPMVAAAPGPDERVRALLLRAGYLADVTGDLAEAQRSAREATGVEGAPVAENASAWLALEVLAGRTGDTVAREDALEGRTAHAGEATWRALLLVDRARARALGGQVDAALQLVQRARSLESQATWTATALLEQTAREQPGIAGTDEARTRTELHATALEALAELVRVAIVDGARGDALGVPHWVRQPARGVDAWLRAADARRLMGQFDRAARTLDAALAFVDTITGDERPLAEAALAGARIRIAEQIGDTGLAAQLAERRLASEKDGGVAAALAMRVAEHAAAQGDAARAMAAMARAIEADPGCLPARALQLDVLADGGDGAAFAAQLEAFADHLATDEARGRAFLLSAYVWAVRAGDVAGAKAALSQAGMFGIPGATVARVARTLASATSDAAWHEEATKRLLATGSAEGETVSLYVDLLRARHARGDAEGAAKAVHDMAGAPKGAWLAHVLEAFLPTAEGEAPGEDDLARARTAVEQLMALETDPELSGGFSLVAAMRAHASGDVASARARLRELADRDPSDIIVSSYLADLDRGAGDHASAARVASDTAAATGDAELAAALRLEAGFERWRDGDRTVAVEEMEAAAAQAPEAAGVVLGWASWGVDPESIDGRRRAIDRAEHSGGNPRVLALERFATEISGGDSGAAGAALAALNQDPEGSLGVAAAIGRLAWSGGATDAHALDEAIARIGARGPGALALASAEQVRLARAGRDPEEIARAARHWFEVGGGLPAALEWLAAASALGQAREEWHARLAIAESLSGDARAAILASAAMLQARMDPEVPVPLVAGDFAPVRLANLELAPPGCDPRRRSAALAGLNVALGDDAGIDATALFGWAVMTADVDAASEAFEKVTRERPNDLAAWEGLRVCAERSGDALLRARAAAELGGRCLDAARGAAFWEEAALQWLDAGDGANGERALEASFARDPSRAVGFDKLFRRVRERKDNDRLLGLITRRLEFTDDPKEIQKLFWEQARVLREKGDLDGALAALEHVTLLDADHVGALALLGEINIRRGNFEEAAKSLARLAKLENAPAKNRTTAGIAAVDLYEKRLGSFDKALDVLLALHRAKLSTLPVRERLARAAARSGAWKEATAILEELMHERPQVEARVEAARLAMAIHRDRLNHPQDAAKAIVKLLEEDPGDGEALDMLLQTNHPEDVRQRLLRGTHDALLEVLARRPTDVASVRRLVKVARALKMEALEQAALGALACLAPVDAKSEQAFAQLAAKKPRAPQVAASEQTLRAILATGDAGPIANLFILLGPTLAEAFGPSLQTCGVGRRDKVDPRSGLSLRNEIGAWAGAIGVREFDLYVGGKESMGVQGIPGEPPALVVGAGVNGPLTPLTRARVARELLGILRGTTVTRSRDDLTIAAIVVAACKLGEVAIDHPAYAVLAEVERLVGKAISRKTRRMLPEACQVIAASRADARAWSKRAVASQDRIAAIASGDLAVVLSDVLGTSIEKLGKAVAGDPRAEDLLRFVLSPHYIELRRSLGLESGAQ